MELTGAEIDALASEVLDSGGELMRRHKVFTRTRLIAEIAPRLYGHDPAQLDPVIDRVLASRQVVPLIGVVGAHEQAYATAEVLATEAAIAQTIGRLADRPGPRVMAGEIDEAIDVAEAQVGRVLTDGQVDAIRAVCASGRAVDVVIGVAGAGKTTALNTARDVLEAGGYRVLGTSTSGQAARTLHQEAGITSATLASLLWRLDHHQLTFDQGTVVVLDEAAMTADADLLRLTVGIERNGAKLVLVGDQRQLSAIGPGGAIAALLERRPEIVTVLDDNVRQTDPDERAAIAELRDGSVPASVDWYARAGRTAIASTRTEALATMVDQWAHDIAAGHRTALLAWRRQDVTDLNRLARARYDQLGHLHGDDLVAAGGRPYAVGDLVVTVAPNPAAQLVTSQHLTVTAVDYDAQTLTVRTDDGRLVALTAGEIDRRHLDHAYALTVHRAQGATYDRAHVYADGGGRELGYVAMSRARDRTTLHAVADDLPQAIEDLHTDWSHENRQRWISDTPATIGHQQRTPISDVAAHHERLRQERARSSKPSHQPTPPTRSTTPATASGPCVRTSTTCNTAPAAGATPTSATLPGTRSMPNASTTEPRPTPAHPTCRCGCATAGASGPESGTPQRSKRPAATTRPRHPSSSNSTLNSCEPRCPSASSKYEPQTARNGSTNTHSSSVAWPPSNENSTRLPPFRNASRR